MADNVNQNVAVLSLMASLKDNSKEVSRDVEKLIAKVEKNAGTVEFGANTKDIQEAIEKINKLIEGKLKGIDLTKQFGSILKVFASAESSAEDYLGILDKVFGELESISRLPKTSLDLMGDFSPKQIDQVLKKYDELIKKQEQFQAKQEKYRKKAQDVTPKSLISLKRDYGDEVSYINSGTDGAVGLLSKQIGLENNTSAKRDIKEYSQLLAIFNLLQDSKKKWADIDTAESALEQVQINKNLLSIVDEIIKKEKRLSSAFGAKDLLSSSLEGFDAGQIEYSILRFIDEYSTRASKVVKDSIVQLQNELDQTILDYSQKNINQMVSAQEKASEKVQARINKRTASTTSSQKGTQVESADIVEDSVKETIGDVQKLDATLESLGDDSDGLDLWAKSAENLKEQFADVIKYAVDAETALEKVNELMDKQNPLKGNTALSRDEKIDLLGYIQRLGALDAETSEEINKFFAANKGMPGFKKIENSIWDMTEAQLEEIERLKTAQPIADTPATSTIEKQVEEATEAIEEFTQAEKEAQEQTKKLEQEFSDEKFVDKEEIEKITSIFKQLQDGSKIKVDVDIAEAVTNTETIRESIDKLPEVKQIEIRVKDYSDMPYLTDPKTGQPLTLYRGTRDAISGTVGADQNGLSYYSTDRRVAESYIAKHGGKITTANGAMKNPLEIDVEGSHWNELTYIGEGFDETSSRLWDLKALITQYREDLDKLAKGSTEYKEISDKLNAALEEQKKLLADTSNPYVMNATTDEFADKVKATGLYDGLILKNIIDGGGITATDVIFFDEQQIRNAQVLNSELDETVQKKEEIVAIDKVQEDSSVQSQIEAQQKLQVELEQTEQQAKETSSALSQPNQTEVSSGTTPSSALENMTSEDEENFVDRMNILIQEYRDAVNAFNNSDLFSANRQEQMLNMEAIEAEAKEFGDEFVQDLLKIKQQAMDTSSALENMEVNQTPLLSDDELVQVEDKIQDVGNGTKRIISEIGMSYDDFIKKVKSDNSLEERFAVFDKYGKVIESLKGDLNSLVLPDNMNTSGASKILHSHPSMNALGGTLSEDDYLQWYSKFLSKGIGEQFELMWQGKSLKIDLSQVEDTLKSSVISALVNISHVAGLQLEKQDGEIPLPLSDVYNSLSNGLLKDVVERNGGTVTTNIIDETNNQVRNIETLLSILNDFGNFRRLNVNNDDAIKNRIEEYKSVLKFLSEHEEYTYEQIRKILDFEKFNIKATGSEGLTHSSMTLKNDTAEWMSEYLANKHSELNGLSVNADNFDPFNVTNDAEREYFDITCKYYDAIAEGMDAVVRRALEGEISEGDFVNQAMASISSSIKNVDNGSLSSAFEESSEYVREYITTRFNQLKTDIPETPMIEVKNSEEQVAEQSIETGNAIKDMISKFSVEEIEEMANALKGVFRGLLDVNEVVKSFGSGITEDDLYTALDIVKDTELFESLKNVKVDSPISEQVEQADEDTERMKYILSEYKDACESYFKTGSLESSFNMKAYSDEAKSFGDEFVLQLQRIHDEAKETFATPIKDTFDTSDSTATPEQHTANIKAETSAVEENTDALKQNTQAQESNVDAQNGSQPETLRKRLESIFEDANELKQILNSLNDGSKFSFDFAEGDSYNKINLLKEALKDFGYVIKDAEENTDTLIYSGKIVSQEDLDNLKNGKVLLEEYNSTLKTLNSTDGKTSDYEKQLNLLKEKLKEMRLLVPIDLTNDNKIKELEELDTQVKELISDLRDTKKYDLADQVSIDKLSGRISDTLYRNTAMPKNIKEGLEGLRETLKQTNLSKEAVKELEGQFVSLASKMKATGKTGASVGDKIKKKFGDVAAYFATYVSIYDFINMIRQGYQYVAEIDKQMIELEKVSNMSDERLAQSFQKSIASAKELGSTIADVVSATADWSRLGYDADAAEELAQVAILYKNVGDGIDIDTANESLISTLQGFQLDASEAESVVDKFNEVANHYAIDSAGIGEALKRSAASFNAAHTDLSKSIALITATDEVLQNSESTGTLWKTMSARIRGASTELNDLGEETDEYTESASKLRDLIKGLTGFDIMLDENTFKDIYEIILGIGQEWDNLTDVEQASLGEALAGKRNANGLYAVLDNLDTLQAAYETAENSVGSAMKEQEKWEQGLEAKTNKLKASLEELSTVILDSDFLGGLIDVGREAIEIFTTLIDKMGVIPTLLTGVGAGFGINALFGKDKGRLK